ncbi:MAG: hypothetical protein GY816_05610, partial [Cytophagales bacterium]|nr:hypothetical protein [Cytophagales bacterium]
MILQNPSALWGFLLLAIPIIVHLFDFRRIKRIEFSNVAFLQTIQKQNTPRRRLKDLLILLSRLLAFGFLILAFARPTVTSESNAFSAIDNLLVIDNTRSMASKCADFTCLEAAKMASIEVAKSFGQGQYFYNGAHRFRQFISSEELAQQLAPLEFSRENFSLDFERDILSRSQITIVSDFQPEVIDELLEVAADSIPILLIPIQSSADQNLYVDSVFLQNPFSIGDNIRTIAVEVANSGTNEAENVLIRIFNDRNQLSSAAVTIGANESRTVRFEIENSPNPIYRVEVEDYEMDFDNDYYFTIPRFEPIRIAVLGDKKNRPIEAIFENSEFFDLGV